LKLGKVGYHPATADLDNVYLIVSIEHSDAGKDMNKNAEQLIQLMAETRVNDSIPNKVEQQNPLADSLPLALPELHYYKIQELDVKPEMVGEINTRPAQLAVYKQSGEIKIQIWIDEQGNVIKSEILNSNLPQAFIDYTLASFNQSKFTAGIKDGMPVRSVAKVVVQYATTE
jgi:hypothetical protein